MVGKINMTVRFCCRMLLVMLLGILTQSWWVPSAAVEQGAVKVESTYLTLYQALDEALMNSPRAGAIRAQLPIAKAGYAQATVMPNPQFIYQQSFKADQVREIGAQVTVEPPWKLVFRLIAAKRQVTQQDLQNLRDLWALRADVRRAYLNLVIAQETLALRTDLAEIFRKLLTAAEEKFNAGQIAQIDAEKARLASQQADVEVERQAQQVILSRQHLSIIMGRDVDAPLTVPRLSIVVAKPELYALVPDFARELKPLPNFVSEAMVNRPQLKVVEQTIRTNHALLANAYGNIIPNPQFQFAQVVSPLEGGATSSSSSSSSDVAATSGPSTHKGYFIGATVPIPVFDVQQGEIARLKATIKQLKLQLQAQRNVATDEVVAAYRRLVIAYRVTKSYQDRVLGTSDKVVRMTEESYKFGRSDITAALVSAQLNIQTQTQYLGAISEYQQALTDLEQAIGKPLE